MFNEHGKYWAKEHLCGYARVCFSDQTKRKKWTDEQTKLLPEDGISTITELLRSVPAEKDQEVRQCREKLAGYYETNRKRMRYRTFIDAGYMTGSGAVEPAHRTVIQQRLKLSGQQRTTPGTQFKSRKI